MDMTALSNFEIKCIQHTIYVSIKCRQFVLIWMEEKKNSSVANKNTAFKFLSEYKNSKPKKNDVIWVYASKCCIRSRCFWVQLRFVPYVCMSSINLFASRWFLTEADDVICLFEILFGGSLLRLDHKRSVGAQRDKNITFIYSCVKIRALKFISDFCGYKKQMK